MGKERINLKCLKTLEKGTPVSYSMYKDVYYEGSNDKHVILKDKKGNKKEILKELFIKYAFLKYEQERGD